MLNTGKLLRKLLGDERGQDLVEYALIAVLIGLGTIVATSGLANLLVSAFATVGSRVVVLT